MKIEEKILGEQGPIYEVYGCQENKSLDGTYTEFLIYRNGEWVWVNAFRYKPYPYEDE